ncbi:MAG: VOC family protein [Alcanivoracaceae bacterium]|nr:VOC family protein [Alcanivoracaceae bacterium]
MFNGIKSIDHPVIAVENMSSSAKTYEKLGFTVPPRGSHVEWGTGNWCIMFADDYLELRGILNPERYTLNLDKVLDQYGEGLMGIAFGTDSAKNNYNEMSNNGIKPERPVQQLTRNFELSEGWVQPKFSLCFPNDEDITGLMHVVCCQHLTPELIRKPQYLTHANGVTGVISMTGLITDTDKVERVQQHLLGKDAVKRIGNSLHISLPSKQHIHLLSAKEYQTTYGELSRKIKKQSHLGVTSLKVDDITKIKNILSHAQIPFKSSATGNILVGAEYTCGVVLEFIE